MTPRIDRDPVYLRDFRNGRRQRKFQVCTYITNTFMYRLLKLLTEWEWPLSGDLINWCA